MNTFDVLETIDEVNSFTDFGQHRFGHLQPVAAGVPHATVDVDLVLSLHVPRSGDEYFRILANWFIGWCEAFLYA